MEIDQKIEDQKVNEKKIDEKKIKQELISSQKGGDEVIQKVSAMNIKDSKSIPKQQFLGKVFYFFLTNFNSFFFFFFLSFFFSRIICKTSTIEIYLLSHFSTKQLKVKILLSIAQKEGKLVLQLNN